MYLIHREYINEDKLYTKPYYLSILRKIYEVVTPSASNVTSYGSQYIKIRLNCPYFGYCGLAPHIPALTHMEWVRNNSFSRVHCEDSFPSPIDIFGDDCKCVNCRVSCDDCGKTVDSFHNFTHEHELVVHHNNYDAVPDNSTKWYDSFAFLCRSCNSKHRIDNNIGRKVKKKKY